MNFNLIELVYILIAFQCLILAIFLFNYKKGKTNSNHYLGSFFLTILFTIIYSILYQKNILWKGINFECSLMLLYGVTIYFYIKSICYKDFNLQIKNLWHFIPHFIIILWLLGVYYLPDGFKSELFTGKLNARQFTCVFTGLTARIHFAIYLFLSFQELMYYRKVTENTQSAENRVNVNWLLYMIYSGLLITLFSALRFITPVSGYSDLELPIYIFELLLTLFFINSTLYYTLNQPAKFLGISVEDKSINEASNTKYAFSNLSSDQINRYLKALLNYIQNERPYLEPAITLTALSKRMNIPSKHLSQVINEKLNQNFYEFINFYRIEEAKRLLSDATENSLRINEVMYDSGFTSKSTFNNTFKKFTGTTPSQFRKSITTNKN